MCLVGTVSPFLEVSSCSCCSFVVIHVVDHDFFVSVPISAYFSFVVALISWTKGLGFLLSFLVPEYGYRTRSKGPEIIIPGTEVSLAGWPDFSLVSSHNSNTTP